MRHSKYFPYYRKQVDIARTSYDNKLTPLSCSSFLAAQWFQKAYVLDLATNQYHRYTFYTLLRKL